MSPSVANFNFLARLVSEIRGGPEITIYDYCNALLYGIADGQLQRLQSVQNAAARLVTGTRRTDHITGWRGGVVVGRRTCDLVVAGSRPGRDAAA